MSQILRWITFVEKRLPQIGDFVGLELERVAGYI